ncbi:uncharacterized protein [Montipora foliosa]|uniref:uncharacterized protein n=1 Tax=Montipora foliosa TaxID=591990 RepID=UPI0035F11A18
MFIFTRLRCFQVVLYTIVLGRVMPNKRGEKIVRILCFGDSLTLGLTSSGSHPYLIKLQENLNDYRRPNETMEPQSGNRHIELHNAGAAGEKVQDMLWRMRSILQRAVGKYNWVIILGGTNDLISMQSIWAPWKKFEDELTIFNGIIQLHNEAERFGAKTVAMTIPPLKCETREDGNAEIPSIKEVRTKLNDRISQFVANSLGKVFLADIDRKMQISRDEVLRSDGVHLTASAYDKIANVIYNALKGLVPNK